MQLCAAFQGAVGDEADDLYDDFRELCPGDRDTDGNTHKTYHSFDSGVSLGWSRLCQITGYMPPDVFDTPVDLSNTAPDPADVVRAAMRQRFVYVSDADSFFDLENRVPLTSTQFDRCNTLVALAGSKGTKAANNIFLNSREHQRARALTYSPGKPLSCRKIWGDALEQLLNWMAHVVQTRGGKINHAVMLYSRTEGVGKDTVFEPLMRMIGKHNFSKITEKDLKSDFNPWLKKEIVIVKEVAHLSKTEITGIKGHIAGTPEDTVRINEKNMRAFEIHHAPYAVRIKAPVPHSMIELAVGRL